MHTFLVPLFVASVILNTSTFHDGGQQPQKEAPQTRAEIRKVLDEKINLVIESNEFDEIIEYLREKTKLAILVDSMSMVQRPNAYGGIHGVPVIGFAGIGGGFQGGFGGGNLGLPPFGGNIGNPAGGGLPAFPGAGLPGAPPVIHFKSNNEKLGSSLKNFLNKSQLTYVILTDKIVIATDERGLQLQIGQRVSVEAKDQTLADVLQKLADDSGINLLIDPRESGKTKTKISLQLADVSVETAVRLLTALADISAVSVGNVLFVTSDSRAEQLRKENAAKKNAVGGIANLSGGG